MITWLREHAFLASILAGAVIFVSSGAVAYHQLSGLIAAQPEVQRHMQDSTRHVDAEEKKQLKEEMDDLKRRVRELEAQRWRQYIDRQRRESSDRRGR